MPILVIATSTSALHISPRRSVTRKAIFSLNRIAEKPGDRLEAQHESFRSFTHPHNSLLRIAQNFLAQGEPTAGPRWRLLNRSRPGNTGERALHTRESGIGPHDQQSDARS